MQFTDCSVKARMVYGWLCFLTYRQSVNCHIALMAMFYLLNIYQVKRVERIFEEKYEL